jgi:hypothetical protein
MRTLCAKYEVAYRNTRIVQSRRLHIFQWHDGSRAERRDQVSPHQEVHRHRKHRGTGIGFWGTNLCKKAVEDYVHQAKLERTIMEDEGKFWKSAATKLGLKSSYRPTFHEFALIISRVQCPTVTIPLHNKKLFDIGLQVAI